MDPDRFIREGAEVFRARGPLFVLERADIDVLKQVARVNDRGRCRICIHAGPSDPVHEMVIAMKRGAYDRPHAHRTKTESFYMVDGSMDVVLFHGDGTHDRVVSLSASGPCFYYHMADVGRVHAAVPRSEVVVFLEITKGPFDPCEVFFPGWSHDHGTRQATDFLSRLLHQLNEKNNG